MYFDNLTFRSKFIHLHHFENVLTCLCSIIHILLIVQTYHFTYTLFCIFVSIFVQVLSCCFWGMHGVPWCVHGVGCVCVCASAFNCYMRKCEYHIFFVHVLFFFCFVLFFWWCDSCSWKACTRDTSNTENLKYVLLPKLTKLVAVLLLLLVSVF